MKAGVISLIGLVLPMAAFGQNPDILINHQGLAQQDLSIRGSSYTGAGLSINGIALKVPYSAHFNAELPVYGPLLSTIGSRTGLNNAPGHLIGTGAMEINLLEPRSINSVGIGTEERYRASTYGSSENVGGYLDWEKARTIDYDGNDLDRFTAGAFVQFEQDGWHFNILSAGQTKRYGAQGYYGIPADVYAEERTDDTLVLAGAFKGDIDGAFMRAGAGFREFDTQYRMPAAALEIDTLSRYGSLMVEGRTLEIQHLVLNLGGNLEHERISGDVGSHDRTRGEILILPEARFERISFKAGLNSVFTTDEAAEWLPQAGIDVSASDNIRLFAAYSETVLQPDYQSLYYFDPYHNADPLLGMQHAAQTELGLRQYLSATLDWQAALFYRRQESAWDWVKNSAADTAWSATDLGVLDVSGIDATFRYAASGTLNFELHYQWIAKDDPAVYAGLYELDYPEQLLAFSGFWQMTTELRIFGTQILRRQTDNNARSGKDFGSEASLGLHYDPRFAKNVHLSFLVENLWDTDFQAIAGLQPRPLSVSTGISVTW